MARRIAKPKYEIVGELEQFDEADNAQARGEMKPDSELWRAYYDKHPELENLGRGWLRLPGLGNVGPIEDRLYVPAMMSTIDMMSRDEHLEGPPSPQKFEMTPEEASRRLKAFARHLGADLVGIGPLNPAWVYSRVGRSHYPGKEIGVPINLAHQHAIVVAVHLNRRMLQCAPQLPTVAETIKNYLKIATITVALGNYLRFLGYSARANTVENYQVLAVPIAVDAGLGELGRNGVLITEEYGNAVKLGVVTTDMPLVHDQPVDIGADEFCRDCKLCARYCPIGAIPEGDKVVVRGVRKWKINDGACYGFWRRAGTDCGVCLSVCPWSRPRHFPHNLITKAVQSSSLARRIAIAADDRLLKRHIADAPDWFAEQPQDWRQVLKKGHPYNR